MDSSDFVLGGIASTGATLFTNPIEIKTQLQSQTAKQIAVGYQHEYSDMISALKEIYDKPGIYGLWRESMATILRPAIGSGAQIVTIGKTKELLREYDIVRQAACNYFCAGLTPSNF